MSVQLDEAAAPPRTPLQLRPLDEQWVIAPPRGAWKAKTLRFLYALRDPGVAIPAAVLVLIVFACFFGPWLFGLPGPNVGDLNNALAPPGTPGHLLGTNQYGNDTLSRILHGGQVSIVVGFGATAIGFAIGMVLGLTAGFFSGLVDATISRVLDTLLSFPSLILALVIADYLGPSEFHTIIAISFYGIVIYARLARSQTNGVRHRDFVVAARATGVPSRKIIFGHVLPNVLPALLAYAMITVGIAMIVEAGLSYLGLGIRPPQPSWGNMIAAGAPNMSEDPWLVVFPSAFLLMTVMSLNLTADGLRRRLALDR